MDKIRETKKQAKCAAILELADQFATVSVWLDDTAYPRKDKLALQEAWNEFKRAFPEHFTIQIKE